jgi:hypothetical protein
MRWSEHVYDPSFNDWLHTVGVYATDIDYVLTDMKANLVLLEVKCRMDKPTKFQEGVFDILDKALELGMAWEFSHMTYHGVWTLQHQGETIHDGLNFLNSVPMKNLAELAYCLRSFHDPRGGRPSPNLFCN